jgi:hypothetical protein
MEISIMKKFFAIIILTVFAISIMGSVSPEINSYVKSWTGEQKYASTILPSPPEIQTNNNLANK